MTAELEFGYTPLGDLKPNPRNARTHSKKQIAQIADNIRELGFCGTVVINPDKLILAGHGRARAAKLVGMEQVPTITVRGLSASQQTLLAIADNKLALNAGWDVDLLKYHIGEIEMAGLDVTLTGYSVGEIDVILKTPSDPADEVIPAVPRKPVSRTGDVWVLEGHRIACGDLLDAVSLSALMAGEVADAVISDPPYNSRINGFANAKGRHAEFKMASGEMSPEQFRAFQGKFIRALIRFSRDGAVHMIFMDWRHIDELMAIGRAQYGDLLNLVVWRKNNAGMGSLYRSQHELIVVFKVGDAPHFNAVELGRHGRNRTNVWDAASVNSFAGNRRADLAMHPTVKPSGLIADAIRDVTRRGEIVLDGFLGSGTALVAAELAGRRLFGMEIEPGYVDVAIERWMAMTGGEAVLEGTRETFSTRRASLEAQVGAGSAAPHSGDAA
jgi:DNA modification methylase